jgi:hypothetical protein
VLRGRTHDSTASTYTSGLLRSDSVSASSRTAPRHRRRRGGWDRSGLGRGPLGLRLVWRSRRNPGPLRRQTSKVWTLEGTRAGSRMVSRLCPCRADWGHLSPGREPPGQEEAVSLNRDPKKQIRLWHERILEAQEKRRRYQEMAAEGLIDFDELREQLSGSTRRSAWPRRR